MVLLYGEKRFYFLRRRTVHKSVEIGLELEYLMILDVRPKHLRTVLGPMLLPFRNRCGRLKWTVRRHKFNPDALSVVYWVGVRFWISVLHWVKCPL